MSELSKSLIENFTKFRNDLLEKGKDYLKNRPATFYFRCTHCSNFMNWQRITNSEYRCLECGTIVYPDIPNNKGWKNGSCKE